MNKILTAVTVLIMLAAASCSGRHDTSYHADSNKPDAASQSAGKTYVSISPDSATRQSVISLKASDALINEGRIQWYINGELAESAKGSRFSDPSVKKGDIIKAVIVSDGTEYESNKITIQNTPPVIETAHLVPSPPKRGDTLKTEIRANDVDGDHISFIYEWTVSGTFAGEEAYLDTELKRGDVIKVKVTPFDGSSRGRSVTLTETVRNSAPVITESEPSFDGKIYRYQVLASDPDNDPLSFKLEEGPEGMKIDSSTGTITWEAKKLDEGPYDVRIRVSDNKGGDAILTFTARFGFEVSS